MNDATTLSNPALPRDRRLRLGLGIARMIKAGTIEVILPDGSVHHFAGTEPGPNATMVVRDARMIAKLLLGGSLIPRAPFDVREIVVQLGQFRIQGNRAL